MIAGYRALATPVRPAVIEPTAHDPDDDHILACALGAQAALIATAATWHRYRSFDRIRRGVSVRDIARPENRM